MSGSSSKPGSKAPGTSGGTIQQGAQLKPPPPDTHDTEADWPVCRCGHPMHPGGTEKRRGVLLERYTCPQRRWWNAWWHPHSWMKPRPQ